MELFESTLNMHFFLMSFRYIYIMENTKGTWLPNGSIDTTQIFNRNILTSQTLYIYEFSVNIFQERSDYQRANPFFHPMQLLFKSVIVINLFVSFKEVFISIFLPIPMSLRFWSFTYLHLLSEVMCPSFDSLVLAIHELHTKSK